MVHVQVVSGLAPPKGMTLPFLSDGGTSLIVSSFAVGLALGAARKTHEELYPCTPSNATA
jgi:cell division protein FtsW